MSWTDGSSAARSTSPALNPARRCARLPAAGDAGGRARIKHAHRGAGTALRTATHRYHRTPGPGRWRLSGPLVRRLRLRTVRHSEGVRRRPRRAHAGLAARRGRPKHVKNQVSAADVPVRHEGARHSRRAAQPRSRV